MSKRVILKSGDETQLPDSVMRFTESESRVDRLERDLIKSIGSWEN